MIRRPVNTTKFVASEKHLGAIKGASCVYFYRSPLGGETKIILIKHKTEDYGVPGGLADPSDQDIVATAIRETEEELQTKDKKPALKNLAAERLQFVADGYEEPNKPEWNPVHWHSFMCKLNFFEYHFKIKPLTKLDPETHRANTENEIMGVEIITAQKLLNKIENKQIKFTYASTYIALGMITRRLLNLPEPPTPITVPGATLNAKL
jgi:8-oxo-dGTP pyrophosphatase MutT (NUDIX family)